MRSDKIIINKEELIELYKQHGSFRKMANVLSVSAKTIERRFKELDLDYKPRHQYYCDYTFFSKERRSRLQYYWAGFIAADGSLSSRASEYALTLSLSHKDEKHVRAFKKDIKSTHTITTLTKQQSINNSNEKEYKTSFIKISSPIIYNDLNIFNIVPNKTRAYKMPEFIMNDQYVNSFILGILDGDGWVRNKDNTIHIGWCGTPELMQQIRNILIKHCNLNDSAGYYERKSDHFAKIEFGGNHQCAAIAAWLYKNNKRFLKRKKDIAILAKELKQELSLDLDKEQLKDLYDEHGTFAYIAKKLKCDDASVKRYMKKYNLECNIKSPAKHNEDYFSVENESPKQLYWAGYLSAKSSIRYQSKNKISLNFVDKNKSKLEEFKKDIETESEIRSHGTNSYAISIFSKKIVDDLNIRFNISKDKIKTYKLPNWLKKHSLVNEFLRGRLDAKGSISGKQKLLEITGPADFLHDVKDIFINNGINTTAQVRTRKNKNSSRFNISGRSVDLVVSFLNNVSQDKIKEI